MAAGAKHLWLNISRCSIGQHFMGNTGPGRKQGLDGAARTASCAFLHKFTHAVKQHDAHSFRQLPKGNGCYGCSAH